MPTLIDAFADLPVPIREYPYWTVMYRPEAYAPERIPTLTECVRLVEKTRVQLRGWDFPHLAIREDELNGIAQGSHWIGSWANFMGSIEFWRLYQSGQFVHFAALREAAESQWRAKLESQAKSHLGRHTNINWDSVPGYVSLVNLVYTITEYFEFAARICQAGVYQGDFEITIELRGAKGYLLTTEWERCWTQYYAVTSNAISKTWSIASDELLARSSEQSLRAIIWICECFGWLSPNVESLRKDQQKLLSGVL